MLLWPNSLILIASSAVAIGILTYHLKIPGVPLQRTQRFIRDLDIIGHRAGGYDAPENTLEAIRLAKRNGASGIEIDLAFSKDHVGILMHDETLGRTTDGPDVPTDQLTLKQLKALNVTVKQTFKETFNAVQIPTLEEALAEAKKLNLKVILDVKGDATKTADTLIPLFEKYKLYQDVVVTSFNPLVVYKVRRRNPRIIGGVIYYNSFITDLCNKHRHTALIMNLAAAADTFIRWSLYSWVIPVTGSSIVSLHKDVICRDEIQYWTRKNIHVMTWTVNSKIQKHYMSQYLKIPYMTDCIRKEDECTKA